MDWGQAPDRWTDGQTDRQRAWSLGRFGRWMDRWVWKPRQVGRVVGDADEGAPGQIGWNSGWVGR